MSKPNQELVLKSPINQINLYGYDKYFTLFSDLYNKGNLPNRILLSGFKGLGKSTFIYHFINYIFSKDKDDAYQVKDLTINEKSLTYNHICSSIHPNFFLIDIKDNDKSIKVDQIRNLLSFINKSTYSDNIKIVLIDNVEFLNLNATNAVLKALEESNEKTFFFLIQNSNHKILETIKSRCLEFKIFFNKKEKDEIFRNLLNNYDININQENINNDLCFDTPGNLLKRLTIFLNEDLNFNNDYEALVYVFIEKYLKDKNPDVLSLIILLIELHYNNLLLNTQTHINQYLFNYSKILQQISDMKKFNLSEKSIFFTIKNILENEKK